MVMWKNKVCGGEAYCQYMPAWRAVINPLKKHAKSRDKVVYSRAALRINARTAAINVYHRDQRTDRSHDPRPQRKPQGWKVSISELNCPPCASGMMLD